MGENGKLYGFLQALEIVDNGSKYDLEVYGQYYKIPKSGTSKPITAGSTDYKYDFGKQEIILLDAKGKEVYRKKVDPKVFSKSEYKWIKLARDEARLELGLDEYY